MGALASMVWPTCAPGVGEPEQHHGVDEHLGDRVGLLVEEGPRQQQRAVGLEREVDERLDRA